MLNNLEFKTNELQGNNISLNKDLQFKMSRHDALLNKLENESATSLNGIKDLQARHQDSHRTMMMRISEVENRVNIKLASIQCSLLIIYLPISSLGRGTFLESLIYF